MPSIFVKASGSLSLISSIVENPSANSGMQLAGPVMLNSISWPSTYDSGYIVTHNWYGISYFRLYACGHNKGWTSVACDDSGALICTLTYKAG